MAEDIGIQEQCLKSLRVETQMLAIAGLPGAARVYSSSAGNCPPRMAVVIPLLIYGWGNLAHSCWPAISEGVNTLVKGEDALSRWVRWMLSHKLFKFCITKGAVKKKFKKAEKPLNTKDPKGFEIRKLLRKLWLLLRSVNSSRSFRGLVKFQNHILSVVLWKQVAYGTSNILERIKMMTVFLLRSLFLWRLRMKNSPSQPSALFSCNRTCSYCSSWSHYKAALKSSNFAVAWIFNQLFGWVLLQASDSIMWAICAVDVPMEKEKKRRKEKRRQKAILPPFISQLSLKLAEPLRVMPSVWCVSKCVIIVFWIQQCFRANCL